MNNPDRFLRILGAIGEDNAEGFDRERHAELVFQICEQSELRASWQLVLNGRTE